MLRLHALRTFLLLVELKSFKKAAMQLNTTQPAVSARLRGLEDFLGHRLVHRHGREVTLTAAGVEVLRYAKPITELADGLEQLFRPAGQLKGSVRIGVIDTIIHSWFAALCERLHHEHPEMRFEIKADTSMRLIEDLCNAEIDIALIMGPVDREGVTNLPLCQYPMAWVAAPGCFQGARGADGAVDVRSLIDYPIISYPRGSRPYRMIEAYFVEDVSARLKLNCSNSLATIIRLVCDGLGVAAIPPSIIRRELDRGELQIIPVRQTFPALHCHACHFTTTRSTAAGMVAHAALEEAARWQAGIAAARDVPGDADPAGHVPRPAG